LLVECAAIKNTNQVQFGFVFLIAVASQFGLASAVFIFGTLIHTALKAACTFRRVPSSPPAGSSGKNSGCHTRGMLLKQPIQCLPHEEKIGPLKHHAVFLM
jgi:hypothetical protein